MFGFLRRHLHRHVRRNIHRPWMQWMIRAYEGITTFFHSLLWFTGFLFLTGHVAATVVQAGYHLSNVSLQCGPDRSVRSWPHGVARTACARVDPGGPDGPPPHQDQFWEPQRRSDTPPLRLLHPNWPTLSP